MRRVLLLMTIVLYSLTSCNNDDDLDITVVPPRLMSEVATENDAEIRAYLETHFYNYEEFASPPPNFDFKIVLDTIAGANADKTPLINQVSSATISVSSDEFDLSEEETVTHTFYYLSGREGVGENPTVADSVFVTYRGSLLSGTPFDGSSAIPLWFDLAQIQGPLQGARGFSEAMPYFKTGGDVVDNGDGTFTFQDFGSGVMFLPSGLGFFNVSQGVVEAYSPLVFTIELVTLNRTDHDRDGVPTILEDVNGDGYLYNDNTDEELEIDSGSPIRASNFLDADDDGDGTLTRDEIIIDEQGNVTFPDADGDGVPDYLDPDTN